MTTDLDAILTAAPVIAVVTISDARAGVAMARALVEGGVPAIEVTLRTPAALDAIRTIAADVDGAIVGAGTILDPSGFDAALRAGARFIVSPGLTPALLAHDRQIPWLPGIATASELMVGLAAGLTRFKMFPAEAIRARALLDAFAAPFPQVRFCPTGGVTQANARDYLARPNVACVGGSWLAPPALVAQGRYDEIVRLASEAATLR
jgi:2-dehydro-3-deoxyphosphogluconate aldolase/(4S)-4-hydroxy-2-oxoglutarate aldolase